MADVFVSYASEDRDRIAWIVDAIEQAGCSVWWDRRIGLGASFDREIERELDAAACVVVIWSKHSIESEWVRNEAHEALERGVLLPVSIDDVKPPLAFRRTQTAQLTVPASSGELDSLLAEIASTVTRVPVPRSGPQAKHISHSNARESATTAAIDPPKEAHAELRRVDSKSTARRQGQPLTRGLAIGVIAAALAGASFLYVIPRYFPSPVSEGVKVEQAVRPARWLTKEHGRETSVAIFPFQDLSHDNSLGQLANAITQDVRFQLSQEGKYEVVPSSIANQGVVPPSVERVIDGSVTIVSDRVVVNVEIFDPSTERRVITESIDWELEKLSQLTPEIGSYLTRFVDATMFNDDWGPRTPAAYQKFKRWIRHEGQNPDENLEVMLDITAIEPSWLGGWVELNLAWIARAGWLDEVEALAKARDAINNTPWVDQHDAWVTLNFTALERARAKDTLREQNPNPYAVFLIFMGMFEEAREALRRQNEYAPYWPPGWTNEAKACAALADTACVLEADRRRKAQIVGDAYLPEHTLVWAYAELNDQEKLRETQQYLKARQSKLRTDSVQFAIVEKLLSYTSSKLALLTEHRSDSLIKQQIANDHFVNLLELGYEEQARAVVDVLLAERSRWYIFTQWSTWQPLLPDQLRDHELVTRVESALGLTPEWRLELCRRIQRQFPPESGLSCNPAKYEARVET